MTKELPEVGLDSAGDISILQGSQGDVHVFAHPEDDVTIHRRDKKTGMVGILAGERYHQGLHGVLLWLIWMKIA